MKKITIVNPTADNLAERLGISPERKEAVIKQCQELVKDEMSKDAPDEAMVVTNVWNAFEEANECAFAVYILSSTEQEVIVNELFRLPTVTDQQPAS